MKIGILTFHRAINYGSVLQAYALQQILSSLGNEVYIIDYIPKTQNNMYSLFKKNNCIKNVIKNFFTIIDYRYLKRRYNSFLHFFENYNLTKPINSDNKIYEINQLHFDAICVGSDQVWNTSIEDHDSIFFLPFDCSIKFSYAPSTGRVDNVEKYFLSQENKCCLKKFTAISVREQIGKEIFSEFSKSEIPIVLDPTLLLNKNIWLKLIDSSPIIDKEYILFYSIEYDNDCIEVVDKFSKIVNIPVYVIYNCKKTYNAMLKGMHRNAKCSPLDFLNYIKNAKYVFSSSYHGTLFSIIFNKQFFSIEKTKNGKVLKEDRIRTVLEKLNINDRIININTNIEDLLNKKIDYSKVEYLLDVEIESSINYIKGVLNN